MDWMPIESAPKHQPHTEQLGICVATQHGSRWQFNHVWWDDEQEEWTDIVSDRFVKPLYWRPLPVPPKAAPEQEPSGA